MYKLKNFTGPPLPGKGEDKLNSLLQKIKIQTMELNFFKLITTFILSGSAYAQDRELLLYELLAKKTDSLKEQNKPLYNLILKELIGLLILQERIGLAYYYSFQLETPDHSFKEMMKDVKKQLLRDLNHSRERLNILFVDDNPANLRLMEKRLKSYNLVTFSHPRETLDHLDRRNTPEYDLIISDYKMRGTTGIEFLNKVRDIRKYTATPLVLHSAGCTGNTTNIPGSIYRISKTELDALTGLLHAILIGKEPLA